MVNPLGIMQRASPVSAHRTATMTGMGQTGGMIALVPTEADAARLAVPGGDEPGELHLTLVYLGDDVSELSSTVRNIIASGVAETAAHCYGGMPARVFGQAVFNPDGHEGRDPCSVYLIGECPTLSDLRGDLLRFAGSQPQHEPYVPHVTAGSSVRPQDLAGAGPIVFDRLRLALADQIYDFPIGTPDDPDGDGDTDSGTGGDTDGDEEKGAPVYVAEMKRQFTADERDKAAKSGNALADGSYPINNEQDLDNAISAYGRAKPGKRNLLKAHIRKHAKRLGKTDKLDKLAPQNEGKSYAALDEGETRLVIQYKLMSPDPHAAKLREYWAHGKGVAKWRPGTPGDFRRLRRHLAKYVHNPHILNGLTANIHKLATGVWPGPHAHGHKSAEEMLTAEEIKAAMLLADPDADLDELPMLSSTQEDTEDDDGDIEDVGDDDEFERALVDDVDWELEGDGSIHPEGEDDGDGADDEDSEDDDTESAGSRVTPPLRQLNMWD